MGSLGAEQVKGIDTVHSLWFFCNMSVLNCLLSPAIHFLSSALKKTGMVVVLNLRCWCDSGDFCHSMWLNALFLPSKLVDIPPPVVACLNPSFHARRGASCHLKDVTGARLNPVRKHLDASVMKICVKSYLHVKKAGLSLHLKLWHDTSN